MTTARGDGTRVDLHQAGSFLVFSSNSLCCFAALRSFRSASSSGIFAQSGPRASSRVFFRTVSHFSHPGQDQTRNGVESSSRSSLSSSLRNGRRSLLPRRRAKSSCLSVAMTLPLPVLFSRNSTPSKTGWWLRRVTSFASLTTCSQVTSRSSLIATAVPIRLLLSRPVREKIALDGSDIKAIPF